MQARNRRQNRVTRFELGVILLSVTLITASSLDELVPMLSRVLRIVAYGSVLFFSGWHLLPKIREPRIHLKSCTQRYRYYLLAIGLYFLGLIIGGLRGPNPAGSLWQTCSDGFVFLYALIIFGFVENDPNQLVEDFLRIVAIWTGVLLLGSLVIYIGNIANWWEINPYFHINAGRTSILMNGPFVHANHLAYVLMIGAFAGGYFALLQKEQIQWNWIALTAFLCLGILITFGRGSMLGTAAGLLIMLMVRDRNLGLLAVTASVLVVAYLVAGAMELFTLPDFLPKISFAARDLLWNSAIENLRSYGPLGVGSGQAVSLNDMSIHNFILEQYGEGGIITVAGVLLWLAIPVATFRRSVLEDKLKISMVAFMVGIMIHGLFWSQFLNGLRFLTLTGVLFWTALAARQTTDGWTAGNVE